MSISRYSLLMMLLIVVGLPAVILGTLAMGKYPVTPEQLMLAFYGKLTGLPTGLSERVETIIWQVRMPRILAALAVGASLSAAGAIYQTMFRNPLVSPEILGVSNGAGLGAVFAIFLGVSLSLVMFFSVLGGLLAAFVVITIAGIIKRHDPILVLVLAGIAVSAIMTAGISLFLLLADPYTQLATMTFWLMGGLNTVTPEDLSFALPMMLFGLVPMMMMRWRINLLSLSDEEASSLGVNVARIRLVLICSATVMTAAAVAISGIIHWVGLIVPHAARLVVGPAFSRLLPASLIIGGIFMLITDTLARSLMVIEIPLGILTSFVGAPVFLMLLIGQKGKKQ